MKTRELYRTLYQTSRRLVSGASLCALLLGLAAGRALADGTITGQGRFEKIKGKPSMGYAFLYESNLFLCRDGGVGTGPSRRLGAPPGEAPRGDGYFSIQVPAGSYSILVNQPLFFIRPKVLPDLEIRENRTSIRNVDLPIDFSTYFTDTWALPYSDVWYQTFTATGTSITGVSWRLAGTDATRVRASILRDNGNPNPSTWPAVSGAASREDDVEQNSDNWVRWRSGDVPTTPGERYAVKLTGVAGAGRGFAPYNRAKDGNSYEGGRAFNGSGQAQNYDLNITVFSDNDGTAILLCKTTVGLGDLRDGYYGGRWGQTFKATRGTSLAAADVWAAGADKNWDLDFTWRVRKGGPTGEQVGTVKTTKAAYQAFGAGLHGVSYNPGEVPLEAGGTYYIEFTNPIGFNPYVMTDPRDAYAGGAAYQDGQLKDGGGVDLSMTIITYTAQGGTVEGRVADSKTGAGLAGATVTVTGLGRTVLTDGQGNYEIAGIPAGSYDLRAAMAGYSAKIESDLGVVEGETTTVDFDLDRAPCTHVFRNESFESAFDGWTRYGGAKTSNPGNGWFGGIDPKDGLRFWGNEVNGGALGTGGMYQRFCAEPGHRYRTAVWSNIYWIEGTSSDARSRIGLHPSGGAEPDATVVWSSWDRQVKEMTEGWRLVEVEARASGPVMTLFLEFEQRDAASGSDQWRINCFDAVQIEDLDAGVQFTRGDCMNDGKLDLTDAVSLLAYLFQGGGTPPCLSACDANDDGGADLSDAVAILGHLFLGEDAPPPPYGSCGVDPTQDALTCETYDC